LRKKGNERTGEFLDAVIVIQGREEKEEKGRTKRDGSARRKCVGFPEKMMRAKRVRIFLERKKGQDDVNRSKGGGPSKFPWPKGNHPRRFLSFFYSGGKGGEGGRKGHRNGEGEGLSHLPHLACCIREV